MNKQQGLAGRIRENWFLIALVSVVVTGVAFHSGLDVLTRLGTFQSALVFAVMWMMAAGVPFDVVRNTLAKPLPGIVATLVNLGLVPLLTLLVIPFLRDDLAGGLLVAATVPSTLASAAVWTRKAGGDDTVAIFVTLLTNLSCVLVTPAWLAVLLGQQVQLDTRSLMLSLLVIVVLPIAVAQLMRLNNRFCKHIEQQKSLFSTLCQIGILTMVLIGSVQMGQRLADSPEALGSNWLAILMATVAACLVHVTALVIAWWLASALGIARPQKIAVSLSGSQKTLMIGLKLALDCGVSILPMVVYHVSQLLIDAVIVKRWSRDGKQLEGK